jgi:protocatechuate 3,4-dioxygenase beta subunit
MDTDDVLVGRLLTRREVLVLMAGASVAVAIGCGDDKPSSTTATSAPTKAAGTTPAATRAATAAAANTASSGTTAPSCVVIPELTEGPYFVDEMLNRSDIRSDPSDNAVSAGDQLDIAINVSKIGGDGSCAALAGAQVDVWHCDALGVYSDVSDQGFTTTGKKFLRGYQLTDANGKSAFTTIYPGWYQGRATHIHFKIRTEDGYEFTSQWFFDDALSDKIHVQGAYASRGASGRLQNSGDGIFGGSNGLLTLAVTPSSSGYAATFDVGLQV